MQLMFLINTHCQVFQLYGTRQPRYCLRDNELSLPPETFVALFGFLEVSNNENFD